MELRDAIEFAQSVWPIARVVAPALFALGWISPAIPTRKRKDGRGRIDNDVIERSGSLADKIKADIYFGHFPKLKHIAKLTILDITRGAFIYRAIHNFRFDSEIEKLRRERRNLK